MLGSPDPDSSTAFFLKMSSEIRAAFLTAPQFWSLRKKRDYTGCDLLGSLEQHLNHEVDARAHYVHQGKGSDDGALELLLAGW